MGLAQRKIPHHKRRKKQGPLNMTYPRSKKTKIAVSSRKVNTRKRHRLQYEGKYVPIATPRDPKLSFVSHKNDRKSFGGGGKTVSLNSIPTHSKNFLRAPSLWCKTETTNI